MRAHADLETYFGEDVSPYPPISSGGPNEVPRPSSLPNAQRAALQFHSRITNWVTESFESFVTGSSPSLLTFGTNAASLTGTSLEIDTVGDPTATSGGGFPITGTNLLWLGPSGMDSFFTVTFSNAQAAFGFYGTDVEFDQFKLTLIGTNGTPRDISVPVTVPQGSGGAFFFGVIDKTIPFTALEFHKVGTSSESFGFDDMTVGVSEQILPRPATVSLNFYPGIWIEGTVGASYRVEFVDSLTGSTNGPWNTLTNVLLPSSPFLQMDTTATNRFARFYRVVGVP